MIYFTFKIVNPFANFDDQKIAWRLFKDDGPFNNITIYKHTLSLFCLGLNIDLRNCYFEIGLFGYVLLLDKS